MAKNYSLRSTESARTLASELELMQRVAELSATAICAGAATAEDEELTFAVRPAIAQADAARRLLGALEVAASRDVIAMFALRVAVCDFTHVYRGEGLTPERVLIALKQLIDNRALPPIRAHVADRSGNRLRESVSTWCINAYFDAEGACT